MSQRTEAVEFSLRLPRRLSRVTLDVPHSALSQPSLEAPGVPNPDSQTHDRKLEHWQSVVQVTLRQLQADLQALRQALPRLAAELALFLIEEAFAEGVSVPVSVWQRRLQELTSSLTSNVEIVLALHPEDLRWWQSDEGAPLRAAVPTWTLIADPRLRPGEYRVEWGDLRLWWRWSERLAALRQAVLQRMDTDALE